MTPKRIQRKRTKGWRMPENAVYVGRPTKWGNPFRVTADRTLAQAAQAHWIWLYASTGPAELESAKQWILEHLDDLRGKDIVCWCREGEPCHADVLLEMANAGAPGEREG